MEECGICFKDLENNLMLSDSSDDSDDSDDDNVTIKPKNNTIYNPISIEIINSLENCFLSLIALDLDNDVSKAVLNAIPIIPRGNCAILSAK